MKENPELYAKLCQIHDDVMQPTKEQELKKALEGLIEMGLVIESKPGYYILNLGMPEKKENNE